MVLRNRFRCVAGLCISVIATLAMAQTTADREIVPSGKLRVGINGANATLYARAADGGAGGIAADIGKFIAEKLGVPFEPLVYSGAATYTASFGKGEWDIIVTVAFAVSTAKGWSPAAKTRLTQLVNEAKAAGIVHKAIEKSGLKGVRAAPE